LHHWMTAALTNSTNSIRSFLNYPTSSFHRKNSSYPILRVLPTHTPPRSMHMPGAQSTSCSYSLLRYSL
jgi:hypothetical protein